MIMISNLQLLCVVKLDTSDGKTYEAHLRCLNREDGMALVSQMEDRSSINGFEVKGYDWKPSGRIEEVMGDGGVQPEYVMGRDLFISFKAEEDDQTTAMTNLLWDINSVIK